MVSKKFRLIIGGALLLLYVMQLTSGDPNYRTYSPDHQYSVYAEKYIYNFIFIAMPGHGGDASGKVFLYDEINHEIIATGSIPMINLTPVIRWEENEAYYVGEDVSPNISEPWKLPRRINVIDRESLK